MTNVFPLRRLRSSGLVLLVALGALHVVVAGDTDPSLSAVERVQRLAQNVERAESVLAAETGIVGNGFDAGREKSRIRAERCVFGSALDTAVGRERELRIHVTRRARAALEHHETLTFDEA